MYDVAMMHLVEHRWNGKVSGIARQDVFLRSDSAGIWEVEHRQHGRSVMREYVTEDAARSVADGLCAQGDWKRLDYLHSR
jgi:hypothetical protein